MRIASGGVQHETNTFASTPTTLADFERDSGCGPNFSSGDVIVSRYRGTGTIHGGYIRGAEKAGIELLPLLCAKAQPAGVVQQEAFDTLLNHFLSRLKNVMPVDGVLLDLHGAMVCEKHEDAEGAFIAAVRELVGPKITIITTLDLHANITEQMAAHSNVIIGFDTYPHVDMGERGEEAALLIARMVRGECQPTMAYRQLPLMTMPPMQCTLREPMHRLMQRLFELEQEPGILTATISMGFPFADIRDAGVSVLVTTDGDTELAEKKADEVASWLWNLRDDLQPQLTTIEETIRFCNEEAKGLVLFADGSDNPGGGAPCDGTVALKAILDAKFQGASVGVLYDPETVEQAIAAGVGATFSARIGGKTDDQHGEPVVAEAYVKTLSDGRFTHHGPMMQGLAGELGRAALLIVGDVEVAVSTYRRQCLDAQMLRILGVTPESRRLLVVKSAVHFRADIGPLATDIFDADTPGVHRPDFANYDFTKLRRPLYPFDADVTFP